MIPKISIIVPVYNVEKYLSLCLDSILSQSFTEWECILVNDGSQDRSGSICNFYAAKDGRFRVFHKENGGVSSARNIGIEKAKGDWFVFIDSDDLLYDYSLESFMNNLEDGIDSVCGGYVLIDENKGAILQYNSSRKYDMTIGRDEALIDFYKHAYGDLFNGYLWNRMLKADIIKNNHLRFREDIFIKEDGLFLVQYLCKCRGLHAYTSLPLYKYRTNPHGAMETYSKTFNIKSLSNLYARCYCYKEIKNVTDNKSLIKLSKDSVSVMYKSLLKCLAKERRIEIVNVFQMSVATFKCISPYYFMRHYIKNKIRRNRII